MAGSKPQVLACLVELRWWRREVKECTRKFITAFGWFDIMNFVSNSYPKEVVRTGLSATIKA